MNMKKVGIFIFTVIAFLTASAVCYAQDGSAEIPDLSSRIQGHALELQYGYIDPTDGQHWKLRIPMRPAPTLYVYLKATESCILPAMSLQPMIYKFIRRTQMMSMS